MYLRPYSIYLKRTLCKEECGDDGGNLSDDSRTVPGG